ncbi:hypothetical protein [Spirosoma validum]|uniref:Uncharacterized protein n=1 Tax=Spirosoma validum TaxID=2771355 RepID=A0A927B7W4_9BACT|nr:hypothetical protein [Spirosoma validum]MBD2756989.1 hypothetical protein [Spirosoma validum]
MRSTLLVSLTILVQLTVASTFVWEALRQKPLASRLRASSTALLFISVALLLTWLLIIEP